MNDILIGIVGAPNVGKSSLFNRMTNSKRSAPAHNETVDKAYDIVQFIRSSNSSFTLIDTPSWSRGKTEQIKRAIEESSVVIVVLDGKRDITPTEWRIVKYVISQTSNYHLVINKADPMTSFDQKKFIGLNDANYVSALHNLGIKDLIEKIIGSVEQLKLMPKRSELLRFRALRVVVVGKQNAGKSTLLNAIFKCSRVLTSEQPGTTRGMIRMVWNSGRYQFSFADTAGFRRKKDHYDSLIKGASLWNARSIASGDIIVMVVDIRIGISNQDSNVIGISKRRGKTILLAFNKIDTSSARPRGASRMNCDLKVCFISALKRRGLGNLLLQLMETGKQLHRSISTRILSYILYSSIVPFVSSVRRNQKIELNFLHQGGNNPLVFVIHGKNTEKLSANQVCYILNSIKRKLGLRFISITLQFKRAWR